MNTMLMDKSICKLVILIQQGKQSNMQKIGQRNITLNIPNIAVEIVQTLHHR